MEKMTGLELNRSFSWTEDVTSETKHTRSLVENFYAWKEDWRKGRLHHIQFKHLTNSATVLSLPVGSVTLGHDHYMTRIRR